MMALNNLVYRGDNDGVGDIAGFVYSCENPMDTLLNGDCDDINLLRILLLQSIATVKTMIVMEMLTRLVL